ncbi:MAG: GGDEF domain-containing phosphodiesterase [Sneathiella sp.]|uniref:EAL domain-containing protein n=1 Tax=Sneathiella sp. TaxID=1964365 RepID=UPI003003314C
MTQETKLENLRTEKERFVAFSFAAADLLIELDAHGKICYISGAAKGLVGLDTSDLKQEKFINLVASKDRRVVEYVLESMKEGDRITPVAAQMDKTGVSVVVGACKLPRTHGHIFLALNVSGSTAVRSIMEHRDGDTGLLDRNDFLKLADEQMKLTAETGQKVELTLLHLNGLASMEDRIDESEMEEFLEQVGTILRRYSIGGDSAGRLDSDKYGVVHSPSIDGKLLEEKISELSKKSDPKSELDISHNSLELEKNEMSANNATQALMYVINRFVSSETETFDIKSLSDGMENRLETTMNRMLALKSVFQNYKFNLVYQPIVQIGDGEVHHYEALSRFKDGESPYETVVFAEETGIIHDLDLAVAKKAKDKLTEYQKRGDILPKLAINISGLSLESDSFVDSLLALYEDDTEIRENISLEITETARVGDLDRAERVLQTIRSNGMEISLDDMGAGSSSFQYIRALTVDYIKIDGTYIKEVQTNKKDAAILKSMSRLCQELDIGTIAEMVETKEQLHILKVLGVNYGQGWYFGKPQKDIETKRKSRGISMNIKRKGFATSWS